MATYFSGELIGGLDKSANDQTDIDITPARKLLW